MTYGLVTDMDLYESSLKVCLTVPDQSLHFHAETRI